MRYTLRVTRYVIGYTVATLEWLGVATLDSYTIDTLEWLDCEHA
jgi:hypothetical protein